MIMKPLIPPSVFLQKILYLFYASILQPWLRYKKDPSPQRSDFLLVRIFTMNKAEKIKLDPRPV